jgi:hypothetical protein
MKPLEQLESLVSTFARDVGRADELLSPNEEDDRAIKTAIIGYSYNSTLDDWGRANYEIVRERLESEFSTADLEDYGENGINVRLFYALCAGYLLGLYDACKIDELAFRVAEAQIPGLIALYDDVLTEHAL